LGLILLAACGAPASEPPGLDAGALSAAQDAPTSSAAGGAGTDTPTGVDSTPTAADSPTTAADSPTSGADSPPTGAGATAAVATTSPTERPLPATPTALAAELTEVERRLGHDGIDQASALPWGRRQQVLYRVLSAHPDWADAVLAAAGDDVRSVVGLNWQARSELSALTASEPLRPTLPAWAIRAPRPADELLGYYRESALANGVPWEVLAAINLVETRMGRIQGVSSAGAVGPMQFLPTTWARCCTGDPTDDHDAIVGAGRYLVHRGAHDDLDKAIFGYNRSSHYVRAVRAYAEVLTLQPGRYYGYHAWDVVYPSSAGLVRLNEGYHQTAPVDAAAWVSDHPDDLLGPA
jgi:hypothetical protein